MAGPRRPSIYFNDPNGVRLELAYETALPAEMDQHATRARDGYAKLSEMKERVRKGLPIEGVRG